MKEYLKEHIQAIMLDNILEHIQKLMMVNMELTMKRTI